MAANGALDQLEWRGNVRRHLYFDKFWDKMVMWQNWMAGNRDWRGAFGCRGSPGVHPRPQRESGRFHNCHDNFVSPIVFSFSSPGSRWPQTSRLLQSRPSNSLMPRR